MFTFDHSQLFSLSLSLKGNNLKGPISLFLRQRCPHIVPNICSNWAPTHISRNSSVACSIEDYRHVPVKVKDDSSRSNAHPFFLPLYTPIRAHFILEMGRMKEQI